MGLMSRRRCRGFLPIKLVRFEELPRSPHQALYEAIGRYPLPIWVKYKLYWQRMSIQLGFGILGTLLLLYMYSVYYLVLFRHCGSCCVF